ncbi:type VI secretion system-associated protein TagF [Mesorhizobium sp. A556]
MPAANLSPGFFGKIPATGDFVHRNLSVEFVRGWDRWVARHLAPLLLDDRWTDGGLNFLLGPASFGPMAGIVLPSADRVGRRFPLTVAVPIDSARIGLAAAAAHWFALIQTLAATTQDGTVTADDLAAELALSPFPQVGSDGESVRGMAFWVDRADLVLADPDAPQQALEHLLAARLEPG